MSDDEKEQKTTGKKLWVKIAVGALLGASSLFAENEGWVDFIKNFFTKQENANETILRVAKIADMQEIMLDSATVLISRFEEIESTVHYLDSLVRYQSVQINILEDFVQALATDTVFRAPNGNRYNILIDRYGGTWIRIGDFIYSAVYVPSRRTYYYQDVTEKRIFIGQINE